MILLIDDETVDMIENYEYYYGDDSYGLQLAEKITKLYREQYGELT